MTDAARWKATVYVGGLAPIVTVATLHDAFLPFGDIADVSLPKNENPNSNTTEPHRGFAYVEFEDADDAKEAIDNMDQSEFFGRVIKVTAAKAPKSADEGLGSKTAIWAQVCLRQPPPYIQGYRLTTYRFIGELVGKTRCQRGRQSRCRSGPSCRGFQGRRSDARPRGIGCSWSSPGLGSLYNQQNDTQQHSVYSNGVSVVRVENKGSMGQKIKLRIPSRVTWPFFLW